MTESKDWREHIQQLRECATKHESYHCEIAVKELVMYLKPYDALEIAIIQLGNYLPEFEKYHPDLTWFRAWHDLAIQFKPIDYEQNHFDFWSEDEDYNYWKSASGWISFAALDAIRHLDWAYEIYISEKLTKVFWQHIGSFFTILDSSWNGIHYLKECPDAYLFVQSFANSEIDFENFTDKQRQELYVAHQPWRDCVGTLPYDYWFQVADIIENRLLNQSSAS
jgi:hypothetical protein